MTPTLLVLLARNVRIISSDCDKQLLFRDFSLFRDVDEIFALLGCYAACSGEDVIERLSRNVGKDLLLNTLLTIQARAELRVTAKLQIEKATSRGGDGCKCIDLAAEDTLQVWSCSLEVTSGTNGDVLFRTFLKVF